MAFLVATASAPAAGQGLAVEVKGGAAVGNYTETAAGLDIVPAPAFGVTVEMGLRRSLAGYAGVTRAAFGCVEGFCRNRDMSLASQGVALGARGAPGPAWARAGLAVRTLRVSSGGTNTTTTDPGIGWDLGAGVELPVAGLVVRPGLTYLRHAAGADGRVAVLALEVGLVWAF